MLVAIPALFFLLVWLAAAIRVGLRQGFIVATVVATAGVVAVTELLSVAVSLGRPGLLVFWTAAAVVAALWFLRRSERQRCRHRLPNLRLGIGRAWAIGRLELVGVAIVLATVLLVALVSPPNSWESMADGMMRVAMWLQQGSVAAYATPSLAQIYRPPLVSYQIAQLLSLGGGDWFANVPEWLALAGCPVAASLLARELMQRLRVQLVAAVVAVTLPMALLQGSSTQGNLLAAYWVLCAVLLLAQHLRSPARWRLVCCGSAAGFALLAASTAFVVLPAAAVALGLYGGVARRQPRRALVALAAAVAIALVVNVGHLARNWLVFDHPVSPMVSGQMNERFDLTVLMANLMRNSLVHWSLPSAAFGERTLSAVSAALGGIPEPEAATAGLPLEESRLPYRIGETETPNFLHHWLLVASAIGLLMQLVRRGASPPLLSYLLAGWLASVVGFSAVLQWQYWGSRHHTMLFMLGAPLAAVFLGRAFGCPRTPQRPRGDWRLRGASLVLLIASVPWLLFKESAPLLAAPAAGTQSASIFARSRAEAYFAQIGGPSSYRDHVVLADQIVALQQAEIGLDISWSGGASWIRFSYPLLALVRERREDAEFSYVYIDAEDPTAIFQDARPRVLVKAGGPLTFRHERYRRLWTQPDGTMILRRWPRPLRVLRPDQLADRWSRRIEAGICEAALGADGPGAFLHDDLLIYVGVRRPNAVGERPPVVELWSPPIAGQPFQASQGALGRTRLLRSFAMPPMWERSNDDGAWTVLANTGRGNEIIPKPADVGARLRATMVSDCGGRRWYSTSAPSPPVAAATSWARSGRSLRQEAPEQLVVRAERRASAAAGRRRVTRPEIALNHRQVPTLVTLAVVAIRFDPKRLVRLHIADVAPDGRVLWQQSLPIPEALASAGE